MGALVVELGKLRLKNPVMTASGTSGYGEELSEYFDLSELGAFVVKGISLNPMPGNPPPRITETPCGMLNAIGLQNVGLEVFLKEKLPFVRRFDVPVVVNVLGNTPEEYVEISRALDAEGVEAIELNVSCPNVKSGGISFGVDKEALSALVSRVRDEVKHSLLIVKLSPNVSNVSVFAKAAEQAGADALSLINTIPALAVDIATRRPVLRNITGGLSGPAIKPIALRMVSEAYRAVDVPIIGMGGISSGRDALEFIIAGASAVAVGTASFLNPKATINIIGEIAAYLAENSINSVENLVGSLRLDNPVD